MTEPGKTIVIECFRFNPGDDAPHYQTYQVPFTDDMSVLQGLQYIKDEVDGTLTFRWSCRMAICGSCGSMIDGIPRLMCQTFLRDYHPGTLRIDPLNHFPVVRDLAIDQDDFVRAKLPAVMPYLVPKQPSTGGKREFLQTPQEMHKYYHYSECINCLLCYAACPQYGLDSAFIGPAAIALMHRYNADSRDAGRALRMELANSEQGVWGCTLVGYCSEVCPKGVDPAHAVNQNKVASTFDYFMRFLPQGEKA